MNRNCCSHFQLCINGSSMGCFVPFCILCPLSPQTGARLGSHGEVPLGGRTFFLQPFMNPKTPPEIKRTLH